jgi:tRNA A37 threonylcarbamoyladenosine synthetase subunit TsaC/SUA5/YrdC
MLIEILGVPLLVGSVTPADTDPELEDPELLEVRFRGEVAVVIDAGALWPDPSTVLRVGRDEIEVLRKGQGAIPD